MHISEIGLFQFLGLLVGEKMPKIPIYSISQKFVEIGPVWKLPSQMSQNNAKQR